MAKGKDDGEPRLHHHRCRFRGLRAGTSAHRESGHQSAIAGGWTKGRFDVDQHSGRLHQAAQQPRYNWNFATEPEDNVKGRSIPIPRGKTLGGSSSINGMLYVRGNPLDYNTWAQFGNRGWSVRRGTALLPEIRTLRAGWPWWPAERRQHDRARRIAGRVHRCRSSRGLVTQSRLQQRPVGGLRLLSGYPEEGPALVHRTRLSRSRPWPAEPSRRD